MTPARVLVSRVPDRTRSVYGTLDLLIIFVPDMLGITTCLNIRIMLAALFEHVLEIGVIEKIPTKTAERTRAVLPSGRGMSDFFSYPTFTNILKPLDAFLSEQ